MKIYKNCIPLIVTFALALIFLKGDFLNFTLWWFCLFLFSLLFLPLASSLFPSFIDKGYFLSKALGIAAAGYIMWLLSSIKLIHFTRVSVIILFLFLAAGLMLIPKYRSAFRALATDAGFQKTALYLEALFLLCLGFWSYIRGMQPNLLGLEKFMDFGFVNSIMRSSTMPPNDMWFSGGYINYYYFGQYLTAFLTLFSGIRSAVTYNLMLATLFAFTFCLPFTLVASLLKLIKPRKVDKDLRSAKDINNKKGSKDIKDAKDAKEGKMHLLGGLLSALAVSLWGNLHTVIYAYIMPFLNKIGLSSLKLDPYWYPNATRYIGYFPDTQDKTIHEFPLYSFVVSDLHAHVLNIIFVLTVLSLALTFVVRVVSDRKAAPDFRNAADSKAAADGRAGSQPKLWYVPDAEVIIMGFFIGIFKMTNFWDYPIYFTVAAIIILLVSLIRSSTLIGTVLLTLYNCSIIFILSELVSLPFTNNFVQIAGQIKISKDHSLFYQLLVLWGYQLTFVLAFWIFLFLTQKWKPFSESDKKLGLVLKLQHRILEMHVSDIFILIVSLCAIGLVIMPELVYVKDIYESGFKRANTMFKLTYQAFIMFGLCIGYVFIRISTGISKQSRKILCISIMSILFLLPSVYPFWAIKGYYGTVTQANYKGLDGMKYISQTNPSAWKAIQWFNTNVHTTVNILEANGLSYSENGSVSMATGLPTVLGWFTHEQLWRNDVNSVQNRANDVKEIYESSDVEKTKSLIKEYDIKYVIIGNNEKTTYPGINMSKLLSLGRTAVNDEDLCIVEIQ